MNAHTKNMIFMAVLGTVFIIMSLNFVTEAIFHSEKPEKPGYVVEVAEAGDSSGGDAPADAGPGYDPIEPLLASADPAAGEKVAKKCANCHSFEKGGPNKVGPDLYHVVNREIAKHEGFSYSAAMSAYGEGKTWTYEELNGFLHKPKKYIDGTAMGFGGIKKTQDRANLIAYLRTLSEDPVPLPGQ